MRRRIFSTFLVLLSFNASALKVSSLNIRWFGRSGEMTQPNVENRTKYIKEFFTKELSDSDIVFFQEIVDKDLLQKSIVSKKFKCLSYDANRGHQFIVACHKKTLKNVSHRAVKIGNRFDRPALILNIKGKLQIAGLHLKAGRSIESVKRREAQIINLYKELKPEKIPTIVIGDVNTETMDISLSPSDEENHIESIESHYPTLITDYGTPRTYDRAFISKDLKNKFKRYDVFEACYNSSNEDNSYENWSFYRSKVSDHCPITLELTSKF